jgi:glycerol-3-phosphate O-acyltransferase
MIFARYIARMGWRTLRGRWYKNGYACVSFGAPVSLRWYLGHRGVDFRTLPPEQRNAEVEVLGRYLMDAVGRIIPALPVPLVAAAMLEAGPGAHTLFEIKGRVFELMNALEHGGAYVHVPRQDREYAIDVGLRMLRMRRLLVEEGEGLAVNPQEMALLRYYANSVAHLLARIERPPAAQPLPVAAG